MRSRHQSTTPGARCTLSGDRTGSGKIVIALRRLVIGALRIYKWAISPLLPPACRYHPTCSEYMREAVVRYGAARGMWMGLKRLARCHPFHAGGFDPVR